MSAALTLTLAMPGLQPLTVGLSRLRADISDWSPFWREEFQPQFYRWMLDTFVLEGGNSGASWRPLSPAYAAWKARRFPGRGILVRSGAMKASLLAPTAPGAVFRPGRTSLEVGTTVGYAGYHQLGTGRLPQRPMLRVTEAFMRTLGKGMQRFVQARWAERRAAFAAAAKTAGDVGIGAA